MPIVEAVMSGHVTGELGPKTKAGKELVKAVEAAMSAAITFCYSQGITDPSKVKAAMLKARDEVKAGTWKDPNVGPEEAKGAS